MMRYFEWLFPIMKHVRVRREVSVWRCLAVAAAAPLMWAGMTAGIDFYETSGGIDNWQDWVDIAEAFVLNDIAIMVEPLIIFTTVLGVVTLFELIAALVFVRKRPGRRRPLCTWQTIKYVLLGGRTWIFLAVAYGILSWGMEAFLQEAESERARVIIGLAACIAMITMAVVVMGSTAVQAALAVIALQDDRQCVKCGYFLIGLQTPRCPECGTPFDPAKLSKLCEAAALEQPVASSEKTKPAAAISDRNGPGPSP